MQWFSRHIFIFKDNYSVMSGVTVKPPLQSNPELSQAFPSRIWNRIWCGNLDFKQNDAIKLLWALSFLCYNELWRAEMMVSLTSVASHFNTFAHFSECHSFCGYSALSWCPSQLCSWREASLPRVISATHTGTNSWTYSTRYTIPTHICSQPM